MNFSRVGNLDISFKQKLLLGISLSIFIVIGIGGAVANWLIQERLKEQARQQMDVAVQGIQSMVRSMVLSSIKNYLKGTSETNLAYLRHVHGQFVTGQISETQAKTLARNFMLSQKIGATGYLVALDCSDPDHPTVAVHPNPAFVGAGADRFPFMTDECHLKSGYFEFTLNLPGISGSPKSMWVSWFEPWRWTLGATPFKNEYPQLVDPAVIEAELTKVDMQGQGFAFIMDTQGTLLSHPDWKGRNMIDARDVRTGTPFVRNMIDAINQGRAQGRTENPSGVIDYQIKDPTGDRVYTRLMHYHYVPETSWIVGVVTDVDKLMAPLTIIRNTQITVMVASIVMALLVVLWAVGPMIRSIVVLSAAVEKIDGGKFDTPLPVLGNDEIGRLALAFHRMSDRLARHTDDLEQRVAERTQALEVANQKLAALSNTDGLTGLANRRRFDEALADEHARARRSGQSLALIMLDVDHFKKYNDHYGHQAGDACLQSVANVLKAQARRAGDLAVRYGGEEFSIILAGTDTAVAQTIAETVRQAIEALGIPHEQSAFGKVTVSIGLALMTSESSLDEEGLLRAADEALYRAKHTGRNRVETADSP